MDTRIIGIDLAVTAAHKAVVLDQAGNKFATPLRSYHTDPADLDRLLASARAGARQGVRLKAVLEATGMAWYPVGLYLARHGVEVYRVNGRQVADLRKVFQRYAKSDRVDARVLARMPLICPERLHVCSFPTGLEMTLQRACREYARLRSQWVASKNRIHAWDQVAWPGLAGLLEPFSEAAFWWRENWYDPWQVREAGVEQIVEAWQAAAQDEAGDTTWVTALVRHAERVIALYGEPETLDYGRLQLSTQREQRRLREADEQAYRLRHKTIRPLYRQLHPERLLESIQGVGQDSAAIYSAFIGDVERFPSLRDFRGWTGMVPFSSQSGEAQSQGLRITKAGPNLIKATAYLNAEVARLWDPQIAALYYRLMVDYGKHHQQAVCACATHLLDRIYAVLRDGRPYELRDTDGSPVDKRTARRICQERYQVPDETRRRNNRRVRKERQERLMEQRAMRRNQTRR